MSRPFTEITYSSIDGLKLYARKYAGEAIATPLLCMHGLSRNSADFHEMLEHLAGYPAVSVDQRGRGRSQYDNEPSNYRPDIYCQDMFTLLETHGLKQVIAVGTSMGGLMTMMMASMNPRIFKAAIINDIGPEVDPAGLERLRGYVGKRTVFESWEAAAKSIKAQGPQIFPEFEESDWLAFARRTCEETQDGKIRFAYDPAIQDGIKRDEPSAVPPDLWPLFDNLKQIPLLIIRGETSDILSTQTAQKMSSRHPICRLVTVPGRGHAPLLTETSAIESITTFLEEHV